MGLKRIIIFPTSSLRKQAGQLMKLCNLWPNARRKKPEPLYPDPYVFKGVPNFLAEKKGINTKFITKRQIVMNRHLTEIISEAFLTGLGDRLSEKGVKITSIETKAWNKGVDIFYHCEKGPSIDLQKDLNSSISELRRCITDHQLLGRAPSIRFVVDKTVEVKRDLEAAINSLKIIDKDETQIVRQKSGHELRSSAEVKSQKFTVNFKDAKFSAPGDMSNVILGLDYPELYSRVAAKLEHGRAESTRMRPQDAVAENIPFMTRGQPELSSENPMERIIKMQNFLIRQRKKNERLAKEKRLEDLLARDAVSWDKTEDEDEDHETSS